MVKVAKDKAARDERTRIKSLRGSNSSTSPKRSPPLESRLGQSEGSQVQPIEHGKSFELSIQNITNRLQIETEERAFRLSN